MKAVKMVGVDPEPKAEQMANMSMCCPHRIAQRICVWFSMRTAEPVAVTLRNIKKYFGDHAYSKATVCQWYKQFQNGRTKVGDLF